MVWRPNKKYKKYKLKLKQVHIKQSTNYSRKEPQLPNVCTTVLENENHKTIWLKLIDIDPHLLSGMCKSRGEGEKKSLQGVQAKGNNTSLVHQNRLRVWTKDKKKKRFPVKQSPIKLISPKDETTVVLHSDRSCK